MEFRRSTIKLNLFISVLCVDVISRKIIGKFRQTLVGCKHFSIEINFCTHKDNILYTPTNDNFIYPKCA